jgi:hypothetical protein
LLLLLTHLVDLSLPLAELDPLVNEGQGQHRVCLQEAGSWKASRIVCNSARSP